MVVCEDARVLCVKTPGQDRNEGNVLSHPHRVDSVQREPNYLVARLPASPQRTTLQLRWNCPLFLVRPNRLPAPITTGCSRNEMERLHEVVSLYFA